MTGSTYALAVGRGASRSYFTGKRDGETPRLTSNPNEASVATRSEAQSVLPYWRARLNRADIYAVKVS